MSGFAGRISQETFDEVVRENQEEFDLSLMEAIHDALEQFRKQGVDLSNIDTSGGEGKEEMLQAMKAVHDLSVPVADAPSAVTALQTLQALCDKTHPFVKRNLQLMNDKGGYNDLFLHFVVEEDSNVLLIVLRFLNELCVASEALRDFFEPGGSDKVCSVLRRELAAGTEANNGIMDAVLALARTVARSENNKNALMKAGLGSLLNDILTSMSISSIPTTVSEKACYVMRGLCIHDDIRKEMSCAFDNGKFFMKQSAVIPSLIKLAGRYQLDEQSESKENVALAAAALSAAKSLVTTNEAVQILSLHGINELLCTLIAKALAEKTPLPVVLVRSAVALLRNIAADDARKDQLIGNGALDATIRIMNSEPYNQDASLIEHGFGCLAQFSLRSPGTSQRIVEGQVALEMMVKAMRKFSDRDGLQRQACLTIRNIAGRCPELRNTILDAGVENVLRDAGKLPTVVDEAYSALRDLGCEVQYVKVAEDGRIVPAYEQFGTRTTAFRPIYDEDDSITNRIQEEAMAPFPANNAFRHDHVHDHGDDCDDCC